MTLGHFEAGSGWEAQVRQYVRKKYRQDLAGLSRLDPEKLARLLGGELLPGRPYASVRWVLLLKPFRPLEVYLLFDEDPEFGTDVRVFYARKSLAIPTEDAYVFAWDYLAVLARYGRGDFPLEEAGPGAEFLSFADFAPPEASSMEAVSRGAREEALALLKPETVEVALRRLDVGLYVPAATGWEVTWPLLGDLAFRLRGPAKIDLAFDHNGARKYAPELLMSFAWLYINALLREARRVEPTLPRLSAYF